MLGWNQVVTFLNPANPSAPITAFVRVYDASQDLQISRDAAKYKLAVEYLPTEADSDGHLVSAGWQITWTQPNGITRTENLSKPRYIYDLPPRAVAYFDVIG